jgi:outer membrane immunogenic protein
MKRFLFAGALTLVAPGLFAVGPAAAADLPPPMPPPQAPVAYLPAGAPVYNWGGIYWGVTGGYGFGSSEWTDANNLSGAGTTGSFNLSGGIVGGTLGINLQADAFVFSVEGDFGPSWISGESSSTFCGKVGFGSGAQCETKNTWLGTLRARFGFAADRVLFYGTVGGAYGNIESGINGGFSNSNEPGWVAGAGVEAALTDNWTARLEYLFVDLENGSCTASASCGLDVASVQPNDTVKFNVSLIRAGLDYKFR